MIELASGMAAAKNALAGLVRGKKKLIITFHSLGDMDACASSLALASHLGKNAMVCPPDRVNSESRRILGKDALRFELFAKALDDFPNAGIALLDCNDRSLLGHIVASDVLIDHHAMQKGSVRGKVEWVEPQSSSTSEMVAQIIGKPNPYEADLLIFGILSDSARLARANAKTFGVLSVLLTHASMDYEGFLAKLEKPEGAASRVAVLEGLRNVIWQEKHGLVVATAVVSSHEAHVAEVLVRAGADCAFAGTGGKDARISARMRPAHEGKVDLPLLMSKIGRMIGGHGGGHPAAAGATGGRPELLDEALALCAREFFNRASRL